MAFPLSSSSSSSSSSSLLLLLLLLLTITLHSSIYHQQVSAELILEEGYTVSTLLDANKLTHRINPSSLAHDGPHGIIVLDSPSSVFYTISFPISQDSEVKRFSGNESSGFADGDLGSAMFDRPRSFAVDFKGNVYVADKTNHAIRKITKSGVTTIAGGHSGKAGKVDGPAQYASFSEDFELTFVPKVCALLISDRGNRLIRQINLKPNDCQSGSQLQLGVSGSILLGVSCLILGSVLTLVVGLIIYPFISSREVVNHSRFSETWKRCQIRLERRIVTVCSDIRNVVVSSAVYLAIGRIGRMIISHLSLMFSIPSVEKQTLCKEQMPLFTYDAVRNRRTTKSEIFADQLKDLITFDEYLKASEETNKPFEQDVHEESIVSTCRSGSIDAMIHANISEFTYQREQRNGHPLERPLIGSGLIRRK